MNLILEPFLTETGELRYAVHGDGHTTYGATQPEAIGAWHALYCTCHTIELDCIGLVGGLALHDS